MNLLQLCYGYQDEQCSNVSLAKNVMLKVTSCINLLETNYKTMKKMQFSLIIITVSSIFHFLSRV